MFDIIVGFVKTVVVALIVGFVIGSAFMPAVTAVFYALSK